MLTANGERYRQYVSTMYNTNILIQLKYIILCICTYNNGRYTQSLAHFRSYLRVYSFTNVLNSTNK